MTGERPHERQAGEARDSLRRLDRDSGGVLSSALARAGDHLGAKDADRADPAELWGRRVGRTAAWLAVAALAYLFGHQSGWW